MMAENGAPAGGGIMGLVRSGINRFRRRGEQQLTGASVFLAKNHGEIRLCTETETKSWVFIPASLVLANDERATNNVRIEAILGPDMLTPFLSYLRYFENGNFRRISLNTNVFEGFSEFQLNAICRLFNEVVRECRELVIIGNDEESAVVTNIINQLNVTEVVCAERVILNRNTLNVAMLSRLPITVFSVESLLPEELMQLSGRQKTIHMTNFSAEDLGQFVNLWANSRLNTIDSLILTVVQKEKQMPYNLHTVFNNFRFQSKQGKDNDNEEVRTEQDKFDCRLGVEVHRWDGAIAIVRCYALTGKTEINLHVQYRDGISLVKKAKELTANGRNIAKEYQESLRMCREAQLKKSKLPAWSIEMNMEKMAEGTRATFRSDYTILTQCEKRAMERQFHLIGCEHIRVIKFFALHKPKISKYGYYEIWDDQPRSIAEEEVMPLI